MIRNNVQIYLAGQMDNVSSSDMNDWRRYTKKFWQGDDRIMILDPCRRPHTTNLSEREIMLLDLRDIDCADIILVDNRDLGKPTFGTPCEVFYASYMLNKPVIAWNDGKKTSRKSVFQRALFTNEFHSLEKALDHITEYYVN